MDNILAKMIDYSIQKTPNQVLKDLALKLKVLRKQRKMSQAELADRSGVSLGSLKRFEGIGKVSLESLLKLVHVLGRLDDFEGILQPEEDMSEIKKLFRD